MASVSLWNGKAGVMHCGWFVIFMELKEFTAIALLIFRLRHL